MSAVKRAWDYLIVEPFWWIFLCFFQPRQLVKELTEENARLLRLKLLTTAFVRLALPTFLISYPVTLIIRILLINLHVAPPTTIQTLLLNAFIGTALGIALDTAFGIVVGIETGNRKRI